MTFSPQTVLSGLDHVATKDRWPLLRDALQLQKTSGLADEPNPALVRLEKRYQASRQWVENRIRQQIPVNIDQNLPIGERTDLISKAIADHQVVILTGHISAQDGIKGMGGGANDYLMKPVEFESLLDSLERASRMEIA